ncbi:Hypothetical predicted protein [Podarcis lilfordi]|uniref:Uncharacterized protein n=1 Tax=Podarcis lilfordi TaxID=74358 RepID=A0AA35PNK7_9SAUR|nr:Hypothetical predicted protein [Podarcis lilfordi]
MRAASSSQVAPPPPPTAERDALLARHGPAPGNAKPALRPETSPPSSFRLRGTRNRGNQPPTAVSKIPRWEEKKGNYNAHKARRGPQGLRTRKLALGMLGVVVFSSSPRRFGFN